MLKLWMITQKWINGKTEDWEIKKKEKQELIKNLNCEHKISGIDYFNDKREKIFNRTAKNFHREFCTNSKCIPANGVPNKVIYKSNGWGDEWRDNNHVCQIGGNNPSPSPSNDNCERCQQDIGKNYVEYEFANLNEYYVKNDRTGKNYRICPKCYVCSYCKSKPIEIMTNENDNKWKPDVWLCKGCATNATPQEADKKNSQQNNDNPNNPTPRNQNNPSQPGNGSPNGLTERLY